MSSTPWHSHHDLRGRKILIVDDDRINIRILQGILQKEGYAISSAEDGQNGLSRYEEFQPDLVLLDVLLPDIDGFEICRRIHKLYGERTAPIIFITSKTDSNDVVTGLGIGGVNYLPKPFRAKEVIAHIRIHLQNRMLVEQQKALVEELSRANHAKNRFLGMAAHDLRNPLASIRGLTEFVLDPSYGPLTSEQRDLLKTIHETSNSVLRLVNELLDVATLESGELKLQIASVNLTDLVEKAVWLAGIDATRKNTQVIFESRGRDHLIMVDADKIREVVDNLISNAVKYSPPGSTVRVSIASHEGLCTCRVRDEGPGIPDNERDRLFKDFGRLSNKPTGGEKSVGLGLAICQKIVHAHGGTINSQNLPIRGCEFSFTLPNQS